MQLTLLFWFAVKHFVVDFPLQADPYQYKNKGTYGHPGGILHSLLHFLGTFLVLDLFHFSAAQVVWLSLLDFFLHYHIDWAKVNVARRFDLRPDNSEMFWTLLGFDQFLHYLTYLLIVYLVTT